MFASWTLYEVKRSCPIAASFVAVAGLFLWGKCWPRCLCELNWQHALIGMNWQHSTMVDLILCCAKYALESHARSWTVHMGMDNSSKSVLAKTSEALWVYGSCRDKCCTSIILHSSEIFMLLIELTSPWIALTLLLQKLTCFTFVKEGCCFTSKANGALAAYSSSFFCPACQQRIYVADLISGSEDNRHLIVTAYSWELTKPGMCGLYDTVKKEIVWRVHIIRLFMLWG